MLNMLTKKETIHTTIDKQTKAYHALALVLVLLTTFSISPKSFVAP